MRENLGFIALGIGGVIAWVMIAFGVRLGRPDYDPNEVAKDGPFRAPRKWQHVLKVLIGCTVYAISRDVAIGFGLFRWAIYLALLTGPAILLAVAVKERLRPTDPTPHTFEEHVTDTVTDGACYTAPAVLFFVQLGLWWKAAIFAAVLFALYRLCRNGARP